MLPFINHDEVAFSNSAVLMHFWTFLSVLILKPFSTKVPCNLWFHIFA